LVHADFRRFTAQILAEKSSNFLKIHDPNKINPRKSANKSAQICEKYLCGNLRENQRSLREISRREYQSLQHLTENPLVLKSKFEFRAPLLASRTKSQALSVV
jgi:hypothetical protein